MSGLPKHIPLIIFTALFFLSQGGRAKVHPQTEPPASFPEQAVASFRDEMYMQKKTDRELAEMYRSLIAQLRGSGLKRKDLLFHLAEAAYYMGRGYQSFDSPEKAAAHFTDTAEGRYLQLRKYYTKRSEALRCYEDARKLIAEYVEDYPDSRGYRLYGELLGQMILLEDLPFLLKEGPQAERCIDRALVLDPANGKAKILRAGSEVYTPKLFGGSPLRGIEMFKAILQACGTDREDEFNIYSGIGYAYSLEGDREKALFWFGKASEIYPGNVFVRGMKLVLRK